MFKHGTGLAALLARIGAVVGCLIGLIVFGIQIRHFSIITSRSSVAAAPTASDRIKSAPPHGKSPAEIAATEMANRFQAGFSIGPGDKSDPVAVAKHVVPAPPLTEPALQRADPRFLQASFQRGIAAMKLNDSEAATNEGARLVNMAARLGYEPARVTIVREYPRSSTIRAAVSSAEVVRYSLDPLIKSDGQSGANRDFVALMAAYFFGRHESENYARDLLAALSDDRRLQSDDRLQALLTELSRIGGSCIALSRVVANAVVLTGAECSAALQLQIRKYLNDSGPAGLETESRRQALLMLAREPDVLRDAISAR